MLCYANAALTKAQQPNEISNFVKFWKRGRLPAELVFDSRLATYGQLDRLNCQEIHLITLRRRSQKRLGQIFSRPPSAWQRITLPALTRGFGTPKVLDERTQLQGYKGRLRQVTVTESGHEDPTVLLTNQLEPSCTGVVTPYAHRMLIENGISEGSFTSMVGLKVARALRPVV